MSITTKFYPSAVKKMFDGDLNAGDTFKVALLSSSGGYTASHTTWADVSGFQISGTNYTPGGLAITPTVTSNSTATSFAFNQVMWGTLTATFQNAVIYDETSGALLLHLAFAFSQAPNQQDYVLNAPSPAPTATPT